MVTFVMRTEPEPAVVSEPQDQPDPGTNRPERNDAAATPPPDAPAETADAMADTTRYDPPPSVPPVLETSAPVRAEVVSPSPPKGPAHANIVHRTAFRPPSVGPAVSAAPDHEPRAAQGRDAEAVLEARIRDAVQAAVRYPPAARMMGLTGRARLELNYRDGAVDRPALSETSGASMLDKAALSAALAAHYPASPPEMTGRLLRCLVWVEFRTG